MKNYPFMGSFSPAGAGGLTFARIIKSADQTVVSSTTLVDDDELTVALKANSRYYFMLWIFFSGNLDPDFKYTFTIPAGTTNRRGFSNYNAGGTEGTTIPVTDVTSAFLGAQAEFYLVPTGYVITDGAGQFTLQWAQNTSDIDPVIVKAGSTLVMWEV